MIEDYELWSGRELAHACVMQAPCMHGSHCAAAGLVDVEVLKMLFTAAQPPGIMCASELVPAGSRPLHLPASDRHAAGDAATPPWPSAQPELHAVEEGQGTHFIILTFSQQSRLHLVNKQAHVCQAALPAKGGEPAALDRLHHYLWGTDAVADYFNTRNGMLGADYSTKFSAWLVSRPARPSRGTAACLCL